VSKREVGLSHTVFATVKAEGASHLTGRDVFVRGKESGYLSHVISLRKIEKFILTSSIFLRRIFL